MQLPEWAKMRPEHQAPNRIPIVDVDANLAYPALLSELGVKEPDQYWLEVAYQCIKLDLQVAMRKFSFEIRIHDLERKWTQAKYPKGAGAEQATFGREAREAYRRLRGFVPS